MEARQAERPHSVAAFETLSVAYLAFELVFVPGFTWHDLVWVPLALWIVLSVTRRKSRVARWIFTALCGSGFAIMVYIFVAGLAELSQVDWAGWVLSAAAIAQLALLWSQGTSRWIASRSLTTARPEAAA